jgi:hypothetical protein
MKDTLLQRLLLIAIGAVVLVAVAPEAQGKGGTPITTCGQTVTTNAVLTQDLYCPETAVPVGGSDPGTGIHVGASGITIDLNNFVIRGDHPDTSGIAGPYGIDLGGFDKVTIENGVIRDFATAGVNAQGSDGVVLSNLVVSGNGLYGVLVGGNSVSITSSTVSSNGLNGVEIGGAEASIKSSTVSRNGQMGIHINGASVSITSSTASGNGTYGVLVGGSSASIKSTTASGNEADGMFLGGTSASIASSTASGNGNDGINVVGDSASIASSTASGNGGYGINVQGENIQISRSRGTRPY